MTLFQSGLLGDGRIQARGRVWLPLISRHPRRPTSTRMRSSKNASKRSKQSALEPLTLLLEPLTLPRQLAPGAAAPAGGQMIRGGGLPSSLGLTFLDGCFACTGAASGPSFPPFARGLD